MVIVPSIVVLDFSIFSIHFLGKGLFTLLRETNSIIPSVSLDMIRASESSNIGGLSKTIKSKLSSYLISCIKVLILSDPSNLVGAGAFLPAVNTEKFSNPGTFCIKFFKSFLSPVR